jgi:hypothetical protein
MIAFPNSIPGNWMREGQLRDMLSNAAATTEFGVLMMREVPQLWAVEITLMADDTGQHCTLGVNRLPFSAPDPNNSLRC